MCRLLSSYGVEKKTGMKWPCVVGWLVGWMVGWSIDTCVNWLISVRLSWLMENSSLPYRFDPSDPSPRDEAVVASNSWLWLLCMRLMAALFTSLLVDILRTPLGVSSPSPSLLLLCAAIILFTAFSLLSPGVSPELKTSSSVRAKGSLPSGEALTANWGNSSRRLLAATDLKKATSYGSSTSSRARTSFICLSLSRHRTDRRTTMLYIHLVAR